MNLAGILVGSQSAGYFSISLMSLVDIIPAVSTTIGDSKSSREATMQPDPAKELSTTQSRVSLPGAPSQFDSSCTAVPPFFFSRLMTPAEGVDYGLIFLGTPAAMLVLSPGPTRFEVIEVNDAYLALTQSSKSHIIGRDVFEVYSDRPLEPNAFGPPYLRSSLHHVLATRRPDILPIQRFDIVQRDESSVRVGERYWSPETHPLISPTGEIVMLLHRVIDVTDVIVAQRKIEAKDSSSNKLALTIDAMTGAILERNAALHEAHKKLEVVTTQLEQSMKDTQLASRSQSDFLANISHELRTPLCAITGFSGLLSRFDNLPGDSLEFVHAISASSAHMLALVNDLLDITRMEAGKMTLRPEAVDIAELINEIVSILRQSSREKGVPITAYVDSNLPPAVLVDPIKLRQMVMNLVSNAIKCTDAGEISVRTNLSSLTGENAKIEISVVDTGCGIASDDIARIFQRFEQVGRGPARGGSGLGLSITLQLAKMMNGTLRVESELRVGSTFTIEITVPVMAVSVPNRVPDTAEWCVSDSYIHHMILVVDDLGLNRQYLSVALTQVGFREIVTASNGLEALDVARKRKPALVFMDIYMPIMGGIEATKKLRELPDCANIPVIALTASLVSDEVTLEMERLFDKVLVKPVSIDILCRAMESCGGIQFQGQRQGRRVLVVDDAAFMRRLLTLTLSKGRNHVETTSSGEDAVSLLQTHTFDVVLVDRLMPVMDGLETTRRILTIINNPPPIVIVSANLSETDVITCKEAGAVAVMEKPITLDMFEQQMGLISQRPSGRDRP